MLFHNRSCHFKEIDSGLIIIQNVGKNQHDRNKTLLASSFFRKQDRLYSIPKMDLEPPILPGDKYCQSAGGAIHLTEIAYLIIVRLYPEFPGNFDLPGDEDVKILL